MGFILIKNKKIRVHLKGKIQENLKRKKIGLEGCIGQNK